MELRFVLLVSLAAGLAIPAGALLALRERVTPGHLRDDFLHGVVAFGGGVLLGAMALVLVPEGLHALPVWSAAGAFVAGSVMFLLIDRAIEIRGGQAAQVSAMVIDFVPEAIGLGAAFAVGDRTGPLLALLIGLQNLPEGFNAFRENCTTWGNGRTLAILSALALLGPLAALVGYRFLAGHDAVVGAIFLFAAGGILYSTFHDIAPLAHQRGHWLPTLGVVFGFLVGLVGEGLIR